MGDGGAEESSAIGDRGQVEISLTPVFDGPGSGSLLDSVLSIKIPYHCTPYRTLQLGTQKHNHL